MGDNRESAFAPSSVPTSRLHWVQRVLTVALLLFALPLHAADNAAKPTIRIGLTPVFLDYQANFVNEWRTYLERRMGQPVIFVQRVNYREIVNLLHDE